jgi:hypothetical protein
MKTGEFYYNLLPDDVKDEWDKEFSSWNSPLSIDKKKEFHEKIFSDFSTFISLSFVWYQTEKGEEFWKNILELGEEYFLQNKRDQKLKELGI